MGRILAFIRSKEGLSAGCQASLESYWLVLHSPEAENQIMAVCLFFLIRGGENERLVDMAYWGGIESEKNRAADCGHKEAIYEVNTEQGLIITSTSTSSSVSYQT